MWADHRIVACDVADHEMRHPLVGTLTVTQQTLQSPQGSGPSLVVATPDPGSPSATALKLAHATAPQEATLPRNGSRLALVLPAHFVGERSGGAFGIQRWAPLDRL